MKPNIRPVTRLHEWGIISSQLHTDLLFDTITNELVLDILNKKAKQFIGNPDTFLTLKEKDQDKRIKQYTRSLMKPLGQIPHFLHNKIHFETGLETKHSSLFGTGYHHTFFEYIAVIINEDIDPQILVDAIKDNFSKELLRLRAVIRHEFAHRLEMQKIHQDPVKRYHSSKRLKAVTAPQGHSEYYGKPTEIRAHANHAVELLAQGHIRGWREVLVDYIYNDTSTGHRDTRQLVKYISKLLKDYKIPFTKRIMFRRDLLNITHKMRMKIPELEGNTDPMMIYKTLGQISLDAEHHSEFDTVRMGKKH